ncbi:MAG: hypothetical protein ABR527_05995, partial [Gemmatimonadota bacterium]
DDAWDATLALFGLVAYCAAAAAIASVVRRGRREPFYAFGAMGFAAYLALIGRNPVLVWAIAAYGAGMFVVLTQQSVAWLTRQASSSRWIAAGIAVSIVAWIVQLSVSGFDGPPDSLDLFYLLQIPGVWLLYRGGLQLSERS